MLCRRVQRQQARVAAEVFNAQPTPRPRLGSTCRQWLQPAGFALGKQFGIPLVKFRCPDGFADADLAAAALPKVDHAAVKTDVLRRQVGHGVRLFHARMRPQGWSSSPSLSSAAKAELSLRTSQTVWP